MTGRIAIATQLIATISCAADWAALESGAVPPEAAGLAIGDREATGTCSRHAFSGIWIFAGDFWAGESGERGLSLQRKATLLQAAERFDLVMLNGDRDLGPEVLAALAPQRRLLCRRSQARNSAELRLEFDRLAAVPARYYLLVTEAHRLADGLVPLRFLRELGRSDTVAFAERPAGLWSRWRKTQPPAPRSRTW